MVDITKIQSQIRSIMDTYGTDVTRYAISVAIDKWGDETETLDGGTSIKAIPYNEFVQRWSLIPAGNLVEGDLLMIVKDNATVNVGDKINYNSIDYDVHGVERYILADTVLAQQIALKKRI